MEKVKIVCVGRTNETQGGKMAEYWRPYDRAAILGAKDTDALQRGASLFTQGKRGISVIGGIYETEGKIEDGRLVEVLTGRTFVEKLEGDALLAAQLEAEGIDELLRIDKAEKAALKKATNEYDHAIRSLAHLVAKTPALRQHCALEAIKRAIRDEAKKIKR